MIKKYKVGIKSYKNLEELKQFFNEKLKQNGIFNASYMTNCINTFGGYMFNSKNTYGCYEGGDLEDCKYGLLLDNTKNVQDGNNSVEAQMQYEVSTGGLGGFHDLFCLDVWPACTYLIYSVYCPYSSNLFGCIGLKNQQYCILNKQYTKEDYEQLVPKIIEHMQKTSEWGEFFSPSISPFGYNESAGFEYFPIDKDLAQKWQFPWYEKNKNNNLFETNIPDNIDDVPEDFINKTINCIQSGRPFKIIFQEFNFYKGFGLPIPRKHPDNRHFDRFNLKQKRDLHIINCKKCDKIISSVFESNNLKVYCEECYIKEIN